MNLASDTAIDSQAPGWVRHRKLREWVAAMARRINDLLLRSLGG